MGKKFTISTVYTAADKTKTASNSVVSGNKKIASSATASAAKASRSYRKLNGPINSVASSLKNAVGIAGIFSASLLVGAGAQSVLDFDKNITAASAKFGVFNRQADEFKGISEKAQEIGESTIFTGGQGAEGLKNLATAGFNYEQALSGIDSVVGFAVANQADLASATATSTQALNAFGLKSKDPEILAKNLKTVTNVMSKALTSSAVANVEEFQTLIGQGGAIAKEAGLDFSTFTAIVSRTKDNLGDASAAATATKNAIIKLKSPTGEASELLKSLGVNSFKNGKHRDFLDVMVDLEKVLGKMSEEKRFKAINKIAGIRGFGAVTAIIGQGAEEIRNFKNELDSAADNDLVSKMAQFMGGGISGGFKAFQSAAESIATTLGSEFEPEINSIITSLREGALSTKDWIKNNKGLISTFISGVKVAGALFLAYKTYGVILGVVKAAMFAYNAIAAFSIVLNNGNIASIVATRGAMLGYRAALFVATIAQSGFNVVASLNPIGLVVVSVIALIAGLYLLSRNWDAVTAAAKKYGAAIALIMPPIGLMIVGFSKIIEHWDRVKQGFKSGGILGGIKAIGVAMVDFILSPLQAILELTSKIPGLGFVGSAAQSISDLKADLGVPEPSTRKAEEINTQADRERIMREEKTNKEEVSILIKDQTGRAETEKTAGIPINFTSTFGF